MILSIETAADACSVALHNKGALLADRIHKVEKSHSSLLPGIARDICKEKNVPLDRLDAVAVSSGPGSYTGLRIGVATAKGLCYVLSIPLIEVGTLDAMMEAVKGRIKGEYVLCPMLDARRMEVYTKMEDHNGEAIWEARPVIPDDKTLSAFKQTIYVFGNGMPKFRNIVNQDNLIFIDEIIPEATHMGRMAYRKFINNQTEDVACFEPDYVKEWQTTTPKKK